jgi:hypothetical protein
MRKLFLLLLVSPIIVHAQQNFEGTIRYNLQSGIFGDSLQLEIKYGKTKVKISTHMIRSSELAKVDCIYDFPNGLMYEINHTDKTYSIDTLSAQAGTDRTILATKDTTRILNYPVVRYTSEEKEDIGSGKIPTTINFFVSPAIRYIIPEKMRKAKDIFTDELGNFLWLELSVRFSLSKVMGSDKQGKEDSTLIRATAILPGAIDESGWIIPASYEKDPNSFNKKVKIEMEIMEEPSIPPPPPPPPVKPKQKQLKSKN